MFITYPWFWIRFYVYFVRCSYEQPDRHGLDVGVLILALHHRVNIEHGISFLYTQALLSLIISCLISVSKLAVMISLRRWTSSTTLFSKNFGVDCLKETALERAPRLKTFKRSVTKSVHTFMYTATKIMDCMH